jgi:hypothetical protein
MTRRAIFVLLVGLALTPLIVTGCEGNKLDSNIATFNARATQMANSTVPAIDILTEIPDIPGISQQTNEAGGSGAESHIFDLTTNPNAALVDAWSQVYGLGSGETFRIAANQNQVGIFVIDTLQLYGLQSTVRGGSVALGAAQLRLDLALVGSEGDFGGGTVSFQPTLDSLGRLRLNPQPAQFGGLDLPDNMLELLGDAVHTALTGARNDAQSEVTLTLIQLENGILELEGNIR